MVKVIQKENKELYQCGECGFHYESREWADPPAPRLRRAEKLGEIVS